MSSTLLSADIIFVKKGLKSAGYWTLRPKSFNVPAFTHIQKHRDNDTRTCMDTQVHTCTHTHCKPCFITSCLLLELLSSLE